MDFLGFGLQDQRFQRLVVALSFVICFPVYMG